MKLGLGILLSILCASAMTTSGPNEARVGDLAYLYSAPAGTGPRPLLLVLPPGDLQTAWQQWAGAAAAQGWVLAVASLPGGDPGVQAADAIVADIGKRTPIDAGRRYLAGQGEGASAALYFAPRRPDLWAAVLAVGGSAKPAIDSNRLFAANTQLVPVLWLAPPEEEPLRAKLTAAHYNLDRTPQTQWTAASTMAWLGVHKLDPYPAKVDCESGNAAFGRCYWFEITKLDPTQRNDVLGSSRVPPGPGAYLALGGFGFKPDSPGPGALVGWLPENYKGPLKLGDRIVGVAGREIRDGRQYAEFMGQVTEERPVNVLVERGKKFVHIKTRFALPPREEKQTARVQAEFLSDARELQIVSRGVAELRLNLPPYWAPCPVNWNGLDAGRVDGPGCWVVAEGGKAQRCP